MPGDFLSVIIILEQTLTSLYFHDTLYSFLYKTVVTVFAWRHNFFWFCFTNSEVLFDLTESLLNEWLHFITKMYCHIILLRILTGFGNYKSSGKKWGNQWRTNLNGGTMWISYYLALSLTKRKFGRYPGMRSQQSYVVVSW